MICVIPFHSTAHAGYYNFLKDPQAWLNKPLMRECVARDVSASKEKYNAYIKRNMFANQIELRIFKTCKLERIS